MALQKQVHLCSFYLQTRQIYTVWVMRSPFWFGLDTGREPASHEGGGGELRRAAGTLRVRTVPRYEDSTVQQSGILGLW